MIEAQDLCKEFVSKKGLPFKRRKETVKAVNGVSFSIRRGEIFSLLGPNGAGKTTTIKMLATLLIPTCGSATVKGFDIVRDDFRVRQVMTAVLPGERTLYWKLTARENLRYFGALYGLRGRTVNRKIDELLDFFGIEDKRSVLVEKLSTGQRQKIVLSRALLPDPEVILLDEPTLGLDPAAAVQLRRLIQRIAEHGKTILMTTHYMYEADELSNRVAIINDGRIVCLDTPAELKRSLEAKKILRITADRWDPELSAVFEMRAGVQSVDFHRQHEDVYVRVKCGAEDVAVEEIGESLRRAGVAVKHITIDEPSLEDVFIEKTGESMAEKEDGGADPVLA